MLKIEWGTVAQKHLLKDEYCPLELYFRAQFFLKQTKEWIKAAFEVAEKDRGLDYFVMCEKQAALYREGAFAFCELINIKPEDIKI